MRLQESPHKEDIKAAIRKTGQTLESLSRKHGLAKDTVARSLNKPIPKANRAIASLIGCTLHDLWPSWYDEEGHRILNRVVSSRVSGKRPRANAKKASAVLHKEAQQ